MLVAINCAHCGLSVLIERGAVNRANARSARLFCGRACAGLARRVDASDAQKRAAKAAYDKRRRGILADEIRAAKAAYHKRTYDPERARAERKARAAQHAEYCRRPEYRQWKAEYDRRHRAREYGDYADAYLLALEIRRECLARADDYDIRLSAGTLNKSLQRRREYDRLNRNQSEKCPLGNASIPQGGQYATGGSGRDCLAGP